LAREIHRFRFKGEKLDPSKLKNYEREIRLRLEEGKDVPGFNPFSVLSRHETLKVK
jgi:hypothetical protein